MNATDLSQPTSSATHRAGKSRGGYTRQRQGCLTCRRRKKKCDRCFPVCGHCIRLNLACEMEEPRRVAPIAETIASKTPSRSSFPPATPHDGHVARIYAGIDYAVLRGETSSPDTVASRRAVLRYYTTVFAALLSTNQENNCFLSVMLPMAFECSALMKSLVAWASSHLAARDSDFEQTALEHRGSALNELKTSIDQDQLTSEMCLAVAMVFCSMEAISDTSGSWYNHLLGGAAALGHSDRGRPTRSSDYREHSSMMPLLSSVEGGWLLRNFAYHDALMSVTMDCRPLITGHYWATTDSSLADPYFGLASRIIYLISQISVLSACFNDGVDSSNGLADAFSAASQEFVSSSQPSLASQSRSKLIFQAREIETELLNWACPHKSNDSPLRLLAEAYRSAALLHLYRTLRRHVPDQVGEVQDKITHHVDVICNLVGQMPDGCLAECTLLFPLFIAGGEANSPSHMEVIRSKMQMINQYRHFQNVTQALEVLDDLWRLRYAGASGMSKRTVDWLDITKSRNIKLAIT